MSAVHTDAAVAATAAERVGDVAAMLTDTTPTATSADSLAGALGPIAARFVAAFAAATNRRDDATTRLGSLLQNAAADTVAAHRGYDDVQNRTVTALHGAWT